MPCGSGGKHAFDFMPPMRIALADWFSTRVFSRFEEAISCPSLRAGKLIFPRSFSRDSLS
jgi:hypothetical protein